MELNLLDRFLKNTQISNFMKIRPVAAELFHANGRTDGQTDVTKPVVAFCNFANAPNIWPEWSCDFTNSLRRSPTSNPTITYYHHETCTMVHILHCIILR